MACLAVKSRVCSTSRWNSWSKSMAKSSSVKLGGTGSATASIRTSRIVKGSADGTVCLVFLGSRVNRNTPVMIGANREESFRRPITSPVCCRSGSIRCLVAGADHGPDGTFAEMGTWLGVNESGLVVAVTNRRDGELRWEDQICSRGLLVIALLGLDDAEQAARLAEHALSQGGFGGSNFLIASPESALVVEAPGARRITIRAIEPGVHAVTNLDLDDENDARISLVREHLDPAHFVTSAQSLCRHEKIIIAGAERGTVSSSLALVGSEILLYHVLGNPNQDVYRLYRLGL